MNRNSETLEVTPTSALEKDTSQSIATICNLTEYMAYSVARLIQDREEERRGWAAAVGGLEAKVRNLETNNRNYDTANQKLEELVSALQGDIALMRSAKEANENDDTGYAKLASQQAQQIETLEGEVKMLEDLVATHGEEFGLIDAFFVKLISSLQGLYVHAHTSGARATVVDVCELAKREYERFKDGKAAEASRVDRVEPRVEPAREGSVFEEGPG